MDFVALQCHVTVQHKSPHIHAYAVVCHVGTFREHRDPTVRPCSRHSRHDIVPPFRVRPRPRAATPAQRRARLEEHAVHRPPRQRVSMHVLHHRAVFNHQPPRARQHRMETGRLGGNPKRAAGAHHQRRHRWQRRGRQFQRRAFPHLDESGQRVRLRMRRARSRKRETSRIGIVKLERNVEVRPFPKNDRGGADQPRRSLRRSRRRQRARTVHFKSERVQTCGIAHPEKNRRPRLYLQRG